MSTKQSIMNLKTFTLSLALTFTTLFLSAQTTVPALITSDQTWTAASSPYLINQNTYIDSGVTVTMMPGAELIGSGSYRQLIIDGALNVQGSRDSLVKISGLQLAYSLKSADYHRSVGKEVAIQFADIKGTGVANRVFYLNGGIDFSIKNSKIDSGYYGIFYQSKFGVLGHLTIDSCEIYGIKGSINQGSVLYIVGTNADVSITNSIVGYGRTLYLNGDLNIENTTFKELNAIQMGSTASKRKVLRCNRFENSGEVKFSLQESSGSDYVEFTGNKIDSGHTSLHLSYSGTFSNCIPYLIENNNFEGSDNKVKISGFNSSPSTYDLVNLQNNYWGTTDTAVMDSFIEDYKDNINVFGQVDYSNFLTSPIIGCPSIEPDCPTPSFSYTQEGKTVTVYDSTDVDSGVMRLWSFGEGAIDTSFGESITYSYSDSGTFNICLYTLTSEGVICDSICQSVEIPVFYNCQASFYMAVDTNIAFELFVVENSTTEGYITSYTWDFGDGSSATGATLSHDYAEYKKYELCLSISDNFGCTDTYCDSIGMNENGDVLKKDGFRLNVIQLTAGVDELAKMGDMQAFPNPTSGHLNVQLAVDRADKYHFEIINHLGVVVQKSTKDLTQGEQSVSFDLRENTSGVYFLVVRSSFGSVTKKVVLTK